MNFVRIHTIIALEDTLVNIRKFLQGHSSSFEACQCIKESNLINFKYHNYFETIIENLAGKNPMAIALTTNIRVLLKLYHVSDTIRKYSADLDNNTTASEPHYYITISNCLNDVFILSNERNIKDFAYKQLNKVKSIFEDKNEINNKLFEIEREIERFLDSYLSGKLNDEQTSKRSSKLGMFRTSMMGQTGMRPLISPSPKIQNE